MPVRLRITFLFTLLVFAILGAVCSSIYFFSHQARLKNMKNRLTNRAITTANLLGRSEIFDRELVERIDSLTTISLKHKSVVAFNQDDHKIYGYSDVPNDTIPLTPTIISHAREKADYYFADGTREAVGHYNEATGIVVICAALDTEGLENLAKLKSILLFSFIAGLVISLVGGYIFSGTLLRPIKQITKEVTEISAQNLARRIAGGEVNDEWQKLTGTLNELLNRLQEGFDMQRRFISNASHELSTPLTSISSQLEIALQRERSANDYQKVLVSILQDVQHMNRLTQTLLEFAKSAGNMGGLTISLVRIDEILMAIPGLLLRENSQYEVYLEFPELPENEDELLVFGNSDLLVTAIKNIASNACKYSPDHKATISLSFMPKMFRIDIIDKGDGIPASEIANIFQPFYRVEQTRNTPGFGLGLSLALRFIRLHKGDISIETIHDKGTVFSITIPSAKSGEF